MVILSLKGSETVGTKYALINGRLKTERLATSLLKNSASHSLANRQLTGLPLEDTNQQLSGKKTPHTMSY